MSVQESWLVGLTWVTLTVAVSLRFQPIAYRWAQNLKQFPAFEPQRFVTFFESMASASSEVLAHATTRTDR